MIPQTPPAQHATAASPRVLLFTGPGARGPGVAALRGLIAARGGQLTESDVIPDNLRREMVDVVLLPGGSARTQLNAIGTKGKNILRRFVESGGGFVGVCAGAFAGSGCTQHPDCGLRLLPVMYLRHKQPSRDVRGTVTLALGNEAVEWAAGTQALDCYYHNGALFPAYHLPPGVRVLATVKEGIAGVPTMRRRATVLAGKFGRGNVVLCGPHPEQTAGLQDFTWRMICAALPEP